ncbi:MAG TPA: dihydrodipicolinate synthase family protein [Candidatus Binatia bacterium]|nr:dihydrodipicolinate synthase family protein [Candidatus Binatia bacterium]
MAHYTKREAKEWARENMRGHWSTAITPFLPDGEIDPAGLRRNMEYWLKIGGQGIGITWLTGEFWSLTIEERKRVCELTLESLRGKAFLAVHTAHTSLKSCIELTKHAEENGAHLAVMMPPYIICRTAAQFYEFVKKVAAESNLGIAIFNSIQSGMALTAKEVADLAEIPNVCAVKVATGSVHDVVATHRAAGDKIVVSAAVEDAFFYQDFYGFRQQVLFANPWDWLFDTPGEVNFVRFVEHACRGEMSQAAEVYRTKVNPLRKLGQTWMRYLIKKFGGAYPTPLKKVWAELMGLAAGPVRPPLMTLTDEERTNFARELVDARREAGLSMPPGIR